MFLSKRSIGIYYLWFDDDLGRRRTISTQSRRKSEALAFLREFRQGEISRRLRQVSLEQFKEVYLQYSKSVHTTKAQESASTALREFLRIIGDLPLHIVGVKQIEDFLAVKKKEASEQTARVYFVTLASAFESARLWNHIRSNPFRTVRKPSPPDKPPVYFSLDEFLRFVEAVGDAELRELFLFAVFTGMRL